MIVGRDGTGRAEVVVLVEDAESEGGLTTTPTSYNFTLFPDPARNIQLC
jgi:hypothetical protein